MANKISVLIDVATDKAVSGLKGFKDSIGDADGSVNKFKAGTSSAFGAIQGAAGGLALGAGAALVTFGVKAVGAFTDTALAAGKFADATGLSTEEASRWVAIGDDIGISGETMEKSFGKLAQSIGKNNPLLEEFGITVQKGADGQADMNKTMLHAVDVIKGIQDPTKKAAVAQAALGKGWMDMAELIEQGSGKLTDSMAAVSEAQVIDSGEVEKARKMRESMDTLQETVSDLALTLGEDLVPMATAGAEALTKLVGPLQDINQWSKNVTTGWLEMIGVIDKKEPIDDAAVGFGYLSSELDKAGGAGHMHIEMQEGLKTVVEATTDSTDDLSRANENLADKIEQTTNRFRDLKGELSAEEAFHNAQGMWDELGASAVAAMDAAVAGTEDASQKMFDHKGKVIEAKQQVVELGDKYADLPEEEITRIVALIDEGSLAEAEQRFNILTRNRSMNVSIIASGGAGYSNLPNFAGGGTVPGPMGSPQLVLAHGQEEIWDPRSGKPNPHGAAGLSVTVAPGGIVLTGSRLTPDDVVNALSDFVRRNGPGPIRKLTGT